MVDSSISLAMSLQTNPGAYAVLFGSGVSYTSGIPTGWGIICDLVTKVATMHGEDVGDDPAGWYEARYGKEPDYAELLEAVARTPAERAQLLRSYFEPNEAERAEGLKTPTPAHRSMARLAKTGFVRTFITTNFDRLMEQALADENIVPTVITNAHDIEGAAPAGARNVRLIKVHGDYVDCRIKNTPEELAAYEPEMDRLLDRVIAEHGFIISGWSAMWDKALVDAFLRAESPRYGTWWTSRRPPKGPGAKLLATRRGEFVPLTGADEFFAELAQRVVNDGDPADVSPVLAQKSNLPDSLSSFVGREEPIKAISELLDGHRLVTLHALGGSGKTRTSIEVAKGRLGKYEDGVSFVDLSATEEPERIAETISHALGYGPAKVRAALSNKELLVVLDNCEHVVDAVARFIPELIAHAPKLTVLATSRVPLGVPGEIVSVLEPLAVPDENINAAQAANVESVKLFTERVREVNTRWRLTDEEVPHVARICRILDGHPLALELAAARVKLLSPKKIAERLGEGLKLLKAGSRDARPDRQKTLTAAWSWSLEALDEPAQRVFERLSVFRGGFSLDAIEAVCADEETIHKGDVIDHLTELIDQGLVIHASDARYRFLEPVRQFAHQKLTERGQLQALSLKHAQYFMQVAGHCALSADTDKFLVVVAEAASDLENLRHASTTVDECFDPIMALMFHTAFATLLVRVAMGQQSDEQLRRAIKAAPEAPAELKAAAATALSSLSLGAEERTTTEAAMQAAREAWDAIGDTTRRVECRYLEMFMHVIWCDQAKIIRTAREGLDLGGDDSYFAPLFHAVTSWAQRRLDRHDEALGSAKIANKLLDGVDDPWRCIMANIALALYEEEFGNWEASDRIFDETVELLKRHGLLSLPSAAAALQSQAIHRAILGRTDEALARARAANEVLLARDDHAQRFLFPILHRGTPTPSDIERSLQRNHQRLKLPPVEAAADSLVERLEELEARLEHLGRPEKAADCRRAIVDVNAAGLG